MHRKEESRKWKRDWRVQSRTGMGIATALACLVYGTSCKRLGVNATVDVASFIPPEELTGSYTVPAGSPTVDFDVQPIAIDLEQAVAGLANAESMTLEVAIRFTNTSGEGAGSATVFFGPTAESVYDEAAVATVEAALAPAQTSRASARFPIDARVLELFKTGSLWMGLRLHWQPASADELAGEYTITKIRARVESSIGLV